MSTTGVIDIAGCGDTSDTEHASATTEINRPWKHGCTAREKEKGEPKVKLLPHEATLLEQGLLVDISHGGSNIWLKGEAHEGLLSLMMTVVYEPMGDFEVLHLVKHGTLPSTQPYQAIMEGEAGRRYAEKYLKGIKRVDTSPTTVVEFTAPRDFIEGLFRNQSKIEDGAMSTGLGNKAGKGLAAFNSRLLDGSITYRIVLVKRGHVDANIMAAARDAVSTGTFGTALKHERPAGASSTAASACFTIHVGLHLDPQPASSAANEAEAGTRQEGCARK